MITGDRGVDDLKMPPDRADRGRFIVRAERIDDLTVRRVQRVALCFLGHDMRVHGGDEIVYCGQHAGEHGLEQAVAGGVAQQDVELLVIEGALLGVVRFFHALHQIFQPRQLSRQDVAGGEPRGLGFQPAAHLADLQIIGLAKLQHDAQAFAQVFFQIAGDKIARALHARDKAHQAHGAHCFAHRIAADAEQLGQLTLRRQALAALEIALTNLVFDIFAPNPWTKLYRVSFLKRNQLLFQEIPSCNDWSFAYTSLACAEKISVIREPLVYYRTKTNTSISSQRYKRTKDIVRAVLDLKRQLQLRGLYGCFKNGFARRSVRDLAGEAFSKRRLMGFYILSRNLLIVNDMAVYMAFIQKVIQFLGKRVNKLIAR